MAEVTPYMSDAWKNLGYTSEPIMYSVNDGTFPYQTFTQNYNTSHYYGTFTAANSPVISVTYETTKPKVDEHAALLKEMAVPTPEFNDFAHRFVSDCMIASQMLYSTAAELPGHLKPWQVAYSQIFPWPGWWGTFIGLDQLVRMIAQKKPGDVIYQGLRVPHNVVAFKFDSLSWSDEALKVLVDVVYDCGNTLTQTCALCGKPAKALLKKGYDDYPLKPFFYINPSAELPVCELCYLLKYKK